MPITTLAKTKEVLRIKDTSKDEYISAMIPLVEEWLKGYANATFKDDEGNESYPQGAELTAIKIIEYHLHGAGVTGESLGDYSVSISENIPKSILSGIKRKVKFA